MQSATERANPTLQRQAAIAAGGVQDHAGAVRIEPIENFDLDHTIFRTLEGRLQRFAMRARIGKRVHWEPRRAAEVESAYATARSGTPPPPIDPRLLAFMVDECDFAVEHAEGSFLDHLYFCHEYTAVHYPQGSPLVMLLHSILGTATNTFALSVDRIPRLQRLLDPHVWMHIQAFPSILRLLYGTALRRELWENVDRLAALRSIRLHRVIDNVPIEIAAADFWEALNYQLIHLVDFLPVAHWRAWRADTAFIVFRDLHALLERAGRRVAGVRYDPAARAVGLEGEDLPFPNRIITWVPVPISARFAEMSIRRFSARIGHDLSFTIDWR